MLDVFLWGHVFENWGPNPTTRRTFSEIMLDDDVIEAFRARGDATGQGYQTLINAALRAAIDPESAPLTVKSLRAVLGERSALTA